MSRVRRPRLGVRWLATLAIGLCLPGAATAQTETVEYYGLDAVGSVRIVFTANGAVLGRMDYGPFGEELSASAAIPKERFAGLFRDGEAGLDYAQARMHQPRTGRFTTVDAVYAGLFQPQRWNRYAYALSSPLVYVDPAGLDPCPDGKFCSGVVGDDSYISLFFKVAGIGGYGGGFSGGSGGSGSFSGGGDASFQGRGMGGGGTRQTPTTPTTPTTPKPTPGPTTEPNDCHEYVEELSLRLERSADLPVLLQLSTLMAHGIDMMSRGYMGKDSRRGVSGFKDQLVIPGRQRSDVYKHLNFSAGATATIVSVPAALGLLFIDFGETLRGHPQGPAEIEGDLRGIDLGQRLLYGAVTHDYVGARQSMKRLICK